VGIIKIAIGQVAQCPVLSENHIRDMNKDIDRRLATLQGPLGQISFKRAGMRHLSAFLNCATAA
jgi:hypothetical protein